MMAAELKYSEQKVKFKEHQRNVKWIGKFFGLYPESILLSSEKGIKTPDDSSQFKLEEHLSLLYTIQGDPVPRLHGQDEQGPLFMYTAPNHCLPYQHLYGSTPKRAKLPQFTLKSTTSGSKPPGQWATFMHTTCTCTGAYYTLLHSCIGPISCQLAIS